MLHKYFSKTYLINLDRREDRLKAAKEECDKIGLTYDRFSAVDGNQLSTKISRPTQYWNQGALGILISNLKIILDAKKNNYESILILEDDIEFNINTNSIVESNFTDIPDDWETIFFGSNNFKKSIPITENIHKITGAYALHCYAIKNTIYDLLIDLLSKPFQPVDVYIANNIHSRGKSYCFRPPVAYQKESFSDILNRKVNYNFLRK